MAYLREIQEYKNTIIKKLISLPNIVSAIDSTKIDTPDELIWRNIFPTYKNPNTLVEKMTFITLEMYPSESGKTCNEIIIEISIFTDADIQRTENGYVRTDYIRSEISEAFDENTLEGVGYFEFKNAKPMYVTDAYYGTKMFYSITSLKRLS